eukprot:526987-Prymnesium_polylepis.2
MSQLKRACGTQRSAAEPPSITPTDDGVDATGTPWINTIGPDIMVDRTVTAVESGSIMIVKQTSEDGVRNCQAPTIEFNPIPRFRQSSIHELGISRMAIGPDITMERAVTAVGSESIMIVKQASEGGARNFQAPTIQYDGARNLQAPIIEFNSTSRLRQPSIHGSGNSVASREVPNDIVSNDAVPTILAADELNASRVDHQHARAHPVQADVAHDMNAVLVAMHLALRGGAPAAPASHTLPVHESDSLSLQKVHAAALSFLREEHIPDLDKLNLMHWTTSCGTAQQNAIKWVKHHVVDSGAENDKSTATSRHLPTSACPEITPGAMMEALKIA